ncbi:MAG TPA: outer membrane beta-barrel protein [Flavobacterium sp.]|uniref:outer membrane beta-barrel protein n=1 Tax=Flavobacterium sp. TaxID=239 RepID=UPI002DB89BD1|nr:outer membrane beta-barrel protein [Flavobacterium sp.]HEU4789698.1 outer membrane beta-barrel protein [Flavobacterium sp.]
MKKYITNYIRSILMIMAFLGICLTSYSQEKKHEFSVAVGGPASYMDYKTSGDLVHGNGFSAGLRYSYYLNEGFSVGVGLEYQTYSSTAKYQFLAGQYMTTDSENESFQFRYKATNLREEQKLGYVNIPIGIQFETPGTSKLYLAAGAKIGFATNGTYETSMQNLTTSGYYPQYNIELFGPTFAGFASTDNVKINKQDFNTEVSYSFTFETGFKQHIGEKSSIYIGAYLDYGLNNIYDKNENKNLVQYNAEIPVELKYNSVFDSPYAEDMKLISYGLKLRFAMR